MKQIIKKMIERAEMENDEVLFFDIRLLIGKLAETINCPSNWRDIGTELANEYKNTQVYEELQLWDYEEE